MGYRCARSLTVRVCVPALFYHSFYQVAANADEVVLETEVTNPTVYYRYLTICRFGVTCPEQIQNRGQPMTEYPGALGAHNMCAGLARANHTHHHSS